VVVGPGCVFSVGAVSVIIAVVGSVPWWGGRFMSEWQAALH